MLTSRAKENFVFKFFFHLCALFTSTLCSCTHWSCNHNFKKIVLIPKLHILLYLPFSSTIKTGLFSRKLVSQFIPSLLYFLLKYATLRAESPSICSQGRNKRGACLNVACSLFFPRLGELRHNTGESKFTYFRKANELVKCTYLNILSKNFYQKAQEKILNPPKTENNRPVVVLDICILSSLHK